LTYYPRIGEVLLCNYNTGFIVPEMVKLRPIVIVSPRLRRREGLVALVPLSTSEPDVVMDYHAELILAHPLPPPFNSSTMWAKCDMTSTLALCRLDRFKEAKRDGQQRQYRTGQLSTEQIVVVRKGILHGLGLGDCLVRPTAGLPAAITS
jgi:mRNA interferase MazF